MNSLAAAFLQANTLLPNFVVLAFSIPALCIPLVLDPSTFEAGREIASMGDTSHLMRFG